MKFIQSSVALIFAGLAAGVMADQPEEACFSFGNATTKAIDDYLIVNGTGAGDADSCSNDLAIITLSNDDTAISIDDDPYNYSGNKCVLKITNWDDATKNYDGSFSSIQLKSSQIASINCDNGTADDYSAATNGTSTDTTDKAAAAATTVVKTHTKTRTHSKSTHKKTHTHKKTTIKKTTTKKTKKTSKKHHSSSSSSGSGDGIKGIVTFFTPDTGACGKRNSASDYICALGGSYYGSYSSRSKYCGREILIKTKDGKKSVKVTVEDACESCPKDHIDLSPAAFAELGEFDTGVLDVTYEFL